MDRHSRPGPKPTTLEAVGNQWRYALVVVQAGEEELIRVLLIVAGLLKTECWYSTGDDLTGALHVLKEFGFASPLPPPSSVLSPL